MNFTNLKSFFSAITFALILASCTQVIDISTNAPTPQLVVESSIALNEYAKVMLTKSITLSESNNFKKVTNAVVKMTDNSGNTEMLTEISNGIYVSKTMKGEVGKTYSLRIESEGKTVTALSKIPPIIPIDSFTVINSIFPGGGPPRGNQPAPFYEVNIKYTDPADQQNFYRIITYYNGEIQSRNNIFDDRFNNGKQTEANLIIFKDSAKMGDTISIEMLCIDKPVFNYFQSMGSAGGPRGSSSPANPYTNLNGAILGYFSAHTVERREWVLK
jgi:hypothetical protein